MVDDLPGAVRAVLGLWLGLAEDDNGTVERILPSQVLEHLVPGPGLAGRVRAQLGVDRDIAAKVGLFNIVTVLDDGRLRFSCVVTAGESRRVEAGQLMEGWRVEAQFDEGRWLVDPIRAHDVPGVATVDWTTGAQV